MEMDLASKFKGRGRGTNNRRDSIRATSHGVTTHSNPTPTKPRSTKVDLATVQKSVLRGMGEKELLPKGPKALSRLTRHAGKDAKEGGAAGVLDLINIYGLKDSKAASNPGGGVKELLDFLERKATAPNTISKDTVRIRKVSLTLQFAGSHCRRSLARSGPLSFQAKLSKRRPRYSSHAAFDLKGTWNF